jgi:uncharacterized membrane protein YphA (DoxX/SURF4 family)
MSQRYRSLLCRTLVAITLVAAGLGKLFDLPAFREHVAYWVEPWPALAVDSITLYLPWLELILGLALLTSPLRRAAAAMTLLLLLVFCVAMIRLMFLGVTADCGCFGSLLALGPAPSLAKNMVLVALLLLSMRD